MKPISKKTLAELNTTKTLIRTISNGTNDSFKKFSTEPINTTYSWGTYGSFRIILRNSDGYVNGTQLIREATVFENERRTKSGRKLLSKLLMADWMRNETTKELTETLNLVMGIPISGFIERVKGNGENGERFLQGFYVHPKLVNSLTTWVSPSYALIVADIMEEYHLSDKIEAEKARIKKLTRSVKTLKEDNAKKNDIIADLREMYNSISQDMKVSIQDNKILINEIQISNRRNEILSDTLVQTNQKLDRITNHIVAIASDIRPQTQPQNRHILLVSRLHSESFQFTHRVTRIIVRDYAKRLSALKKRFPNLEIIREFDTPNPVQVWTKIKEECGLIFAEKFCFNLLEAETVVMESFERIVRSAETETLQKL